MRTYFQASDVLVKLATTAVRACSPRCDAKGLIKEAESATRDAEHTKNLILTHGERADPQRVRRALLPFIGSIHKYLYGTLTEADEAEIQEAVRAIAKDVRATAALLANQTEIVEHELAHLNERMRKLEALSTVWANRTAENAKYINDLGVEMSIRASLVQFRSDTEVITNAILFAIKGLIHPKVMAPETIARSAKTIESSINHAKFPLEPNEFSAISIMEISKISILFSKGHLVYHIAIPLVDVEKFYLFKASPVPAIQQMSNISYMAAYIWPVHTYFAISATNRTYLPIPAEKVPKLRKLQDTFIAVDPEPVREILDSAVCEIKTAAGREIHNPEECDIRIKRLKESFWLRLHRVNTWVYSAKHPEDIYIQCLKAEQITAQIAGAGILELREGCTAHTASARLIASSTVAKKLNDTSFGGLQFNVSKIMVRLNESAASAMDLHQAISSLAEHRADWLRN